MEKKNTTDGDSSNLMDLQKIIKIRYKILKLYSMYTLLTKKVIFLTPRNLVEIRVQNSEQTTYAQFVN